MMICLEKKFLIRQYILETDIHPFVQELHLMRYGKNKVRAHGDVVAFLPVYILITMKLAANREKG